MLVLAVIAVFVGFILGWALRAGMPYEQWDHDSIALGYWIATAECPADEALEDWMDEGRPTIRLTCRVSTWATYLRVADG